MLQERRLVAQPPEQSRNTRAHRASIGQVPPDPIFCRHAVLLVRCTLATSLQKEKRDVFRNGWLPIPYHGQLPRVA